MRYTLFYSDIHNNMHTKELIVRINHHLSVIFINDTSHIAQSNTMGFRCILFCRNQSFSPFDDFPFECILEKAMELQGHQVKIFSYKTGKAENRIPYKDIMYFSSETKKIIVHTRNGSDSFYGKLSELNLPDTEFVQIHKSFIINKQYVTRFKFDSVLLSNNEELPISRAYRKTVRENLMS